ncbi:hypothetical protein GCWU000324_00639 [Kingella oralis ATCC 51147]|uniref:Uncharacterized protein n=1 Tax=Kingella oralis ATCC 51147 TaxID=629741 RepID=C4GET0_9NEIS|nr:hypothetical protein GCWU000324_00639 [Kingella oralis ATCC 51147]
MCVIERADARPVFSGCRNRFQAAQTMLSGSLKIGLRLSRVFL